VASRNKHAEIAQSVEQGTENPRVSGSIPLLGIKIDKVFRDFTETLF
jgi:hypothetical protein